MTAAIIIIPCTSEIVFLKSHPKYGKMFMNKDIKSSVDYNNKKKIYSECALQDKELCAWWLAVDKTQNPCYQEAYSLADSSLWVFLVFTKNFLNGYVPPFHN